MKLNYKLIKRISLLFICILFAGLFSVSAFAEEYLEEAGEPEFTELDEKYDDMPEYTGGKTSLNVYNWGQYISDGTDGYINVIKEFEKAYPDISVNYMVFDNNEILYTKLKTTGADFDLIVPSDYMVEKLAQEDMLEPLDLNNIPNFELVDSSLKDLPYDPGNVYSVPYTWGYVGLIYNGRYVDEADVGSWDLLWNEKYSGKILMFDNQRDAFAISELANGFSLNTNDEEEIKIAAEKLSLQKPLVQSYVMDQVFDKMERSEAWIAPYYAGDYLLMLEENEDLLFNIPEEGFNFFVDACCIPKGAKHKKEAELFINFLCRPDVSGPNMEYLGYASPIDEAKDYMSEEFSSDEIIYPPEEFLRKGQSFAALSPEATQLMSELWLEVKTSNSLLLSYLIPVLAVLAIIVALWLISTLKKQRLKKRRCVNNLSKHA